MEVICYRDMTFCPYYEGCKNAHDCNRALTPEVREAARKWWGSDEAPIAVFTDKPNCWESNHAET